MDRPFDCVVAADDQGGIGKDNGLPWPRLKEDLRFLKRITCTAPEGKRNAIVMGRLTWESVPPAQMPLPGRVNVVISRRALALPDGVVVATSLDGALAACEDVPDLDGVFVIGGAQVFRDAFVHPRCRSVYLTRIHATFACDAFLPPLAPRFGLGEVLANHRQDDLEFTIERWIPVS